MEWDFLEEKLGTLLLVSDFNITSTILDLYDVIVVSSTISIISK